MSHGDWVARSFDPCARCHCEMQLHVHMRTGTDCGMCGWRRCRAYRTPPGPLSHKVQRATAKVLLAWLDRLAR